MTDRIVDAFRSSGRTIASLFLHAGCNLDCRFCVSEARFDTLAPDTVSEVLRALSRAGVRNVVFGGGEPTLWEHDLGARCAEARDLRHFVQVSTNGVALRNGFAADERIDRWLLPLESADPAVHDALRGPGHHALVLERLRALADARREVTLTTVMTRANAAGAARLGALLCDLAERGLPLHAWHVYRFVAAGRGGAGAAETLGLAREAWGAAVRAARQSARARGIPVFVRSDVRRSRTVEYVWQQDGALRLGFD